MSCPIWFRDVFFVLFVDQAWAIAILGALLTVRFSALGEREFAARSQVLQSFGIKRYYRYRDEVLMICSWKQGTREFVKMLRGKVQPFKLQAEEQHQVPGVASHQDGNQVRCQASLQDNISCKTLGSDISTSQIRSLQLATWNGQAHFPIV